MSRIAYLVSAAVLVAIVIAWSMPHSVEQRGIFPRSVSVAPSEASNPLPPDEIQRQAAEMAKIARGQFEAAGIESSRASALGSDIERTLISFMIPEFRTYLELMQERGCRPDSRAVALLGEFKNWGFYPAIDLNLGSLDENLKQVWEDPDARRCRWLRVDVSSVKCGLGLSKRMPTPEWPYTAYVAQDSLFALDSGRLKQEQHEALDGSTRSAWFQCRVTLTGGVEALVDLRYYYDEVIGYWVPFVVVIGSDEWTDRPWPLF